MSTESTQQPTDTAREAAEPTPVTDAATRDDWTEGTEATDPEVSRKLELGRNEARADRAAMDRKYRDLLTAYDRLKKERDALKESAGRDILIAASTAHRGCCGSEHDPANGKIHGCCVVCGIPWPCETAQSFIDAAKSDDSTAALRREVEAWIETAQQHAKNEAFYRDLIRQIGEMFGVAAKTSDDGSVQQDVLALKVPELIKNALSLNLQLQDDIEGLTSVIAAARQQHTEHSEEPCQHKEHRVFGKRLRECTDCGHIWETDTEE